MRLYLVRHGETTYNRDGLGLGRTDAPLTDRGRAQARRVGDYFEEVTIDSVLASPLQRAADTARAAVPSLPPGLTEALIELDVGETDGMPFPEMRERYPGFLREWGGPKGHLAIMPGGESLADVDARVAPLLESLPSLGAGHIALVTHNFVLRIILCRLLGLPIGAFRSFAVDLASISTVDVEGSRASVYRLNDTCHLQGLES